MEGKKIDDEALEGVTGGGSEENRPLDRKYTCSYCSRYKADCPKDQRTLLEIMELKRKCDAFDPRDPNKR